MRHCEQEWQGQENNQNTSSRDSSRDAGFLSQAFHTTGIERAEFMPGERGPSSLIDNEEIRMLKCAVCRLERYKEMKGVASWI